MNQNNSTVPFRNLIGHSVVSAEDGKATVTLEPRPELSMSNQQIVAHGGVICTLADSAGALAVNSLGEPPSLTIDLRVDFMSPATGVLTAKATVDSKTSTTAFVSVDVLDEEEEIVAKATGVFKRNPGNSLNQ